MSDNDIQALGDSDVSLDQALSGDNFEVAEQVETVTDPDPAPCLLYTSDAADE